MYKLDISSEYTDPRSIASKLDMARRADKFNIKKFVPNDQKAKEIEVEVSKQGKGEPEAPIIAKNDETQLKARYGRYEHKGLQLRVEEFEKDQE